MPEAETLICARVSALIAGLIWIRASCVTVVSPRKMREEETVMSEMVTLMLTEIDGGDILVECPAEGIRPGMIVEYAAGVGCVKAVLRCRSDSAAYNFACAMAPHQNVPFYATKVYAQCWEGVNG